MGLLEKFLGAIALFVGVINGLILLRNHVRDRPKLVPTPIHPEVYQWWFRLPERKEKEETIRRFGFLVYIGIANKGTRPVQFEETRLWVPVANSAPRDPMIPLNISEPQLPLPGLEHVKVFPALGQRGPVFQDRESVIQPGESTNGMLFYLYECWGHDEWNPQIINGVITGEFRLTDVFGNKSKCQIQFREKSLDILEKMIPGISGIKQSANIREFERPDESH